MTDRKNEDDQVRRLEREAKTLEEEARRLEDVAHEMEDRAHRLEDEAHRVEERGHHHRGNGDGDGHGDGHGDGDGDHGGDNGHGHGSHGEICITVVVNGEPTRVDALADLPLGKVRLTALEQTNNVGQPPEKWELKDRDGNLLDVERSVGSYHFGHEVTLFLSLEAGVAGV